MNQQGESEMSFSTIHEGSIMLYPMQSVNNVNRNHLGFALEVEKVYLDHGEEILDYVTW